MKGYFTREYEKIMEEGTHPNPFFQLMKNIDSIGRAKGKPREISSVEAQVIEFSNYWNLNKTNTNTVRIWLHRLHRFCGDKVGWRLIGEVKHDKGANNPMGVLFWKIKQELPEKFRGE